MPVEFTSLGWVFVSDEAGEIVIDSPIIAEIGDPGEIIAEIDLEEP